MLIPYKDDNPRILIPYGTFCLIAVNLLIFLFQFILDQETSMELMLRFSAMPGLFTGNEYQVREFWQYDFSSFPVYTLITSTFLHAGFLHILSNLIYLYIFADNVESILGHRNFIIFYLVCGGFATVAQIIMANDLNSPIVGASGAISGIMAAYMLKYPSARIHCLLFMFIPVILPASLVVGFWFLTQVINGGLEQMSAQSGGGVAWFAHIGGFIAGAILMTIYSKGNFYWLKNES